VDVSSLPALGTVSKGRGEDPSWGRHGSPKVKGYQGIDFSVCGSVRDRQARSGAYGAGPCMPGLSTAPPTAEQQAPPRLTCPPYPARHRRGGANVMSGLHLAQRVRPPLDPYLLTTSCARVEFGGTVVSDYHAIQELGLRLLDSGAQAASARDHRRVDIEMVVHVPSSSTSPTRNTWPAWVKSAGQHEDLDSDVRHVLNLKLSAGLFRPPAHRPNR